MTASRAMTMRAWADDKYPNIYYAGTTDGLFRSVNLGLTWNRISEDTTVRAITQFNGIDDQAHLRRHRQRRHRRPDRPGPAPGQGDVAQAHAHRHVAQHGGLGPQQLHQHARHAARRHARWRRQGARPHAAGLGRRQADGQAGHPAVGSHSSGHGYQRHLDRHPDDRVHLPVAGLHRHVRRHPGRDRVLVRDPRAEPQVPRRRHRPERLPVDELGCSPTSRRATSRPPPVPSRARCPGDDQTNTGSIKLTPAGQPQPGTILTAAELAVQPAATTSTTLPVVPLRGRRQLRQARGRHRP